MNLEKTFFEFIRENALFKVDEPVLLAVSGGIDSMVLCELCSRMGFRFAIAHAHFGLRAKDSDDDADFVRKAAEKYKVPFFIQHFDTLEQKQDSGKGIQQIARDLRYNWFQELMEGENELGLKMNHLLTAHHADDQVETILMQFLRGTGISGLRGILPGDAGIGGRVVRPLLFASKSDLLSFAQKENIEWREDVSNTKADYTRNALRLKIIPQLLEIFPSLRDNMQKNASRFREIELWVADIVHAWKLKNEVLDGNEIKWPVSHLMKQKGKSALMYELLAPFGFSSGQIKDALQLLNSENGKYIQSSSHRLIRNRKWMVVSPIISQEATRIPVEPDSKMAETSLGNFCFETINPDQISLNPKIAALDASLLQFPLWIRPWEQGDYFYPLGLSKKKKISRFLIDNKLSKSEKERIWVIESDKKIIWVCGLRIDHRFRVTEKTKEVLTISLVMPE